MLQNKVQSKVPNLRFGEFSREWEFGLLNQVADINYSKQAIPDEFYYIDLESVVKGSLIDTKWITKKRAPSRAQRVLKKDDILFQTVRPYQKNNYYFNLEGDYVASTGYAQLHAKGSSTFLYQFLHTNRFVTDVLSRCVGSNYPAINSNELGRITCRLPKDLQEQQKIADFLTSVDKKIGLLQKKVELLKKYKKGMTQKIFSREIRFNENGKEYAIWREQTLGTIFDEVNRRVGKTKVDTYSITAGKGFVSQISKFGRDISGNQNKNYTLLDKGEFSYNKGNSKSFLYGCIYVNKVGKSIAVPNVFISFGLKDKKMNFDYFGNLFSYHYLDRYLKKIISSGARMNGLLNVNKIDFFNIKIPVPVIEEQQKIADFLTAIDAKIALEEQKLSASKKFKKYLLQNMFV